MRPKTAWTGLTAGVLVVAGALAGLLRPAALDEFGDVAQATDPREVAGLAASAETTVDRAQPSAPESDGSRARERDARHPDNLGASPVATRSAQLGDVDDPSPPKSLEIERLGIATPVDPVGVEPDGALEIPQDIRRVGWFRHGVAPGQATGSALLAAHVDGADGPGAFYALREIREGDRVKVWIAEQDQLEYTVTALARYGKQELPVQELFRPTGPHRLVLITCAGPYDQTTRSYAENLVVIAEPSR